MAARNDKEERILNASIKVFSKRGYDLATIDEIASKARVSKGIIFFYYKKKDHLIEKAALKSVPVDEISGVNNRNHNSAEELMMDVQAESVEDCRDNITGIARNNDAPIHIREGVR